MRVAVGRELHRDAVQRTMMAVSVGQPRDHVQHGLLDARVERIVVRRQAAARAVPRHPRLSSAVDQLDGRGAWIAPNGLQRRQRCGKFDRGNQLQSLAVEKLGE